MRLYLDEDSASGNLAALLRSEGHDVFEPPRSTKPPTSDAAHLTQSIGMGRVLLSKNYHDFRELHDLIITSGGSLPGILMIRQVNTSRDMKPREILNAITRLSASGAAIPGAIHILNAYRVR